MGAAVYLVALARAVERFDPAEPRDNRGRWTKLAERVVAAIQGGDRTALDGLKRDQLRNVAKYLGTPMRRGISEEALRHEINQRAPRHKFPTPPAAGRAKAGNAAGRAAPPAKKAPPKKAAKPAAPKPTMDAMRDRLRTATLDELLDGFREISARPGPGQARALAELDAELARREGTTGLEVHDTAHSRRVDDLVARGWSYVDAYADVHGLDPAKLGREQRMAAVDQARLPGERREDTMRRLYAEHVYLSALDAEDATRGNLLNRAGRAAGIDPASLWSGPAARARKYAAQELLEWWEAHGGRRNYAQWRAELLGDKATAAAHRGRGQGRDYGL